MKKRIADAFPTAKIGTALTSVLVVAAIALQPLTARAESEGGGSSGRVVNLYVNPASVIFGMADVGVEFRLTEKWTLAPTFAYVNTQLLDLHIRGKAVGARAAYSFRNLAFEDGPYLASEVRVAQMRVSRRDVVYGTLDSGELTNVSLSGLAGYHWVWPSGFNFRAGVGITLARRYLTELKDSGGTVREDYPAPMNSVFATEAQAGWAF